MNEIQEYITNTFFSLSYNLIWFCNYISLKIKKTCNIDENCMNECFQRDETVSYKNWLGMYDIVDNRLEKRISKITDEASINMKYSDFLFENVDGRQNNSDKLFMVKCGDIWNIRTFSHAYTPLSKTTSQTKFFNIEYVHPNIENIEIKIPKSQYVVNNDILSMTYILCYLEKQSQPFVFDHSYKLQIMDENLNIFDIGHKQYIRILEEGYVVSNLHF